LRNLRFRFGGVLAVIQADAEECDRCDGCEEFLFIGEVGGDVVIAEDVAFDALRLSRGVVERRDG